MPGIVGIISGQAPAYCERQVQTMLDGLRPTVGYVSGTASGSGVYGGWTAHAGSFAARQSAYERAGVILLFSGECFYADGQPTADYLLDLYASAGERFVEKLNGLFSGLLLDRRKKRALLFNDRYGIERLYCHENTQGIFFASEAKALLRVLPELRAFDDEGVAQFLTVGCTLAGRTLFRNLRFLPGGTLYVIGQGTPVHRTTYFSPERWEAQSALSAADFEQAFMDTFRQILPRYFAADAPVGLALTGGLDTRMIMAALPAQTARPVCYTFAGLDGITQDVKLAARIAENCGCAHHILRIGADFLANYGQQVDRTVWITDGCAGALQAHEAYLNTQARQLAPVRLTGNFGSEILRSMSTFKPCGLAAELIDPELGRLFAADSADGWRQTHPVTFATFQEIPWNLFGNLAAGKSQLVFRTPYLDNELVSLAFRAPAQARQTARSALRLINATRPALGKIPTDRGLTTDQRRLFYGVGRVFAEITFKLDYLHKEGLPHWLTPFDPALAALAKTGVLGRHKFLPYRLWYRQEFASYIDAVLTDAHTQQMPYWNSRFLATMGTAHQQGRKNYIREIHAVLTLEAVQRLLIDTPLETVDDRYRLERA